jgi:hypothetical protein
MPHTDHTIAQCAHDAALKRLCMEYLPIILAAELVLQLSWRSLLVWIILILATIVVVIHLLGTLLCLVLRTFLVEPILALGLGKTVDLGSGESNEELLGELMVNRLSY